VLFSPHKLRHVAVHRLLYTTRGSYQLIYSALRLTETLHDPIRAAQLEELHHELDSKIKPIELNKNVLEDGVSNEFQKIHQQRKELDRREIDLIEKMLKEDNENKSLIGHLLEDSVERIFKEEVDL
jgi:hypothetical protein